MRTEVALSFNINDNVIALETTLSLDESTPFQSTQIVYANSIWDTLLIWFIIGAGSVIVIGLLMVIVFKKKGKIITRYLISRNLNS